MRIKEIIKNIYFLEDGQSYRLGVIRVRVNVFGLVSVKLKTRHFQRKRWKSSLFNNYSTCVAMTRFAYLMIFQLAGFPNLTV